VCIRTLRNAEMWTAHDLQLFQDKSGIISNEEFATALGGLFFIIRAAIKQRVPVKTLQKCLKDLDFDKGKSEKLIAEIHAERFSLENVSKSLRIRHPRLDRLKWRIDLTISSAKVKTVLVPCVTMQLALSNGRIVTMELTKEKFSALRYNVAKVLSHIGDLNRHPMIQIMNNLQAEEKRAM